MYPGNTSISWFVRGVYVESTDGVSTRVLVSAVWKTLIASDELNLQVIYPLRIHIGLGSKFPGDPRCDRSRG